MCKKSLVQLFQVLFLSAAGLILTIGFLAGQARATSTILYIDALAGSDTTGNGSIASPYQGIQKAHDVSTDGVAEIFYIRAGATYSSFAVTKGGVGPEQPDIYTVWPGTGLYPKISEDVLNLVTINANYVTLDGLDVDGSAGSTTKDLILSDSSITASHVTIRNSIVHHSATDEGIQLKNAPNAWIENVESYSNGGDGINLCCGSNNSTIINNHSHDNRGTSPPHGGFYFYDVSGLTIANNVAAFNREAGIHLDDTVSDVVIKNNLIISTTIHDAGEAFGIWIHHNSNVSQVTMVNNTIVDVDFDGIRLSDGEEITVTDNIIVSSGQYGINNTGAITVTNHHNDVWNNTSGDWNGIISGTGSISLNPLFVTGPSSLEPDYYLNASNSPAVDTGSQAAVAAGLSLLTTRTDEQGDQGIVDLGYHYSALPYTLTVTANPSSITANGVSTTTLTASLLNNVGNSVPDGTTVVFNSNLGNLENQMFIYTAKTSGSSAQAVLTSVPASSTVTSTITANVYGSSAQTQVPFTAQACGTTLIDWTEYPTNPIFGQGVYSGPKAYYPSVSYSPTQFDSNGDSAYYKMWFGTSSSKTGYAISNDGLNWITRTVPLTNINGYHAHVLYDANQFSGHGDATYYKMWYWDAANSIHYATSNDGFNWTNYGGNPVITNVLGLGSAPVYDAQVIYNSDGNPAFYESWIDNNGKIYYITSTNGVTWTGDNQELLVDRENWESVTYSRASVLKRNGVYHMWYGAANAGGGNHGIGYAASTDGINWTKSADNPIFHKDDGMSWRDDRTYTPAVLYSASRFDGHGSPEQYKMWFTGKQGSNYAIDYATINPVRLSLKTGSGQSDSPNSTLPQPFIAELRDSCNNPVSGITVTFAISDTPGGASGQSLSVVSGATDASGQISTTLTLGNQEGEYTIVASSTGVISLPTTYSATAGNDDIYLPIILKNSS